MFDWHQRTYLMGILNVTPDSFYDGGKFLSPLKALEQAKKMAAQGADIIDLGGESTRPGADPISAQQEIERLLPVIALLLKEINLPVSVDTYKSEVAERVLQEGVQLINDISGFRFDPRMAEVVARYDVPVVVMHTRDKPKVMQDNPVYHDLIQEITVYLQKSINIGLEAGIKRDKIILDPGIGFGKRVGDNLKILKNLAEFKKLNCPLLVGVSRKSFLGQVLDLPAEERLEGSLAALAVSIINGANILRVHDLAESKRAAKVVDAIYGKTGY